MISQITGILRQRKEYSVLVDINGISYEVFLPGIIMKRIDERAGEGDSLTLCTYHYLHSDPSRSIPVLIGFFNEIEREFFERFITVSGVGPKAACRALELPLSTIAEAIDNGDISVLKSLPGIGTQRAREIVAKLQGKIGKYGLIRDTETPVSLTVHGDVAKEALQVLTQLQYRRAEASRMIEQALERAPSVKTCEELLNEVYRQRQKKEAGAHVR